MSRAAKQKAPTIGGIQWREQEALKMALTHGTAILTRHGLRRHHFTELRGVLWHALTVASKEIAGGVPIYNRVRELLQNTADSGIEEKMVEPLLLEIPTGETSDMILGTNTEWYASEIISAWKAREVLRLTTEMQRSAEEGILML